MHEEQGLNDEIDFTKHSKIRMRQRGFSDFTMNIIQQYGRCENAPGNAMRIVFGNKEYQEAVGEFKRAIQLLDKAKGGAMIMSDGNVLTVYNGN